MARQKRKERADSRRAEQEDAVENVIDFGRVRQCRDAALSARQARRLANAEAVADHLHAAAELIHRAIEIAPDHGVPLPRALRMVLKEYRDDLNDVSAGIVARAMPGDWA